MHTFLSLFWIISSFQKTSIFMDLNIQKSSPKGLHLCVVPPPTFIVYLTQSTFNSTEYSYFRGYLCIHNVQRGKMKLLSNIFKYYNN